MDTKNNESALISHGIEELIERLKQEGVSAGKEEANQLINQAKAKADTLIHQAQIKAKSLLDEAHQQIEREKKAAQDALQLAAQNMRLELRQNLMDRFTQEVKRLVNKELDNSEMIRQLILLIAGDTAKQLSSFKEQKIELELPDKRLDFNEIRKNPELLEKDPLKLVVQSLTHQMLKEGMSTKINPNLERSPGVKVHLVDDEIVLDLTEEAVTSLLVKHMQPRFRALLEGLLQ